MRMTDQFDQVFALKGGRLDTSGFPMQIQKMFEGFDTQIDFYLDILNDPRGGITLPPKGAEFCLPGKVQIGQVDSTFINAETIIQNGHEFVGINASLTIFTYHTASILFACPELITLFDAPPGRMSLHGAKGLVEPLLHPNHPRTREIWHELIPTTQISKEMTILCHSLILLHELGHIAGCHLQHPAVPKPTTFISYAEHFKAGQEVVKNKDVFQAMELDADDYAISIMLFMCLFKPEYYFEGDIEVQSRLKTFFFAIHLVFHILDISTEEDKPSSSSTHPSPGVRAAHAWLTLEIELREWGAAKFKFAEFELREYYNTFVYAYKTVCQAWERLELPQRSYSLGWKELVHECSKIVEYRDNVVYDDLLPIRQEKMIRQTGISNAADYIDNMIFKPKPWWKRLFK